MTKQEKERVLWIVCVAMLAAYPVMAGVAFGRPAALLLAFLGGLCVVVGLMCKGLLAWLNS